MSKLYQLTGEWAQLQEAGDNGEDIGEALARTEGELAAKLEGIAKLLATWDAAAAAFRAEETRLAARRKTVENNTDRLREYLRTSMRNAGISKIQGGTFSATLSVLDKYKVTVPDVSKLPDAYVKEKTVREPDRAAILFAFTQLGEVVEGATIEQTTTLRIR